MSHKNRRVKRFILLSFSLTFLIGGVWFTTTNAYTFGKGFLMFKSGIVSSEDMETITPLIQKKNEDHISSATPSKQSLPLYASRPEKGELIGELYIPKLEATLPIIHGTDEEELNKGVGHYAGSVLPGENDNSVLSGHRDTVFRKLGDVGVNDLLIVTTSAGEFTYKVKKVRIVDEDDRTVIVPKPRATLTVSTCYPFTFIGASPERYVLVAELLGQERRKR